MTKDPRKWKPPETIRVQHHRSSPMRPVQLLTHRQKQIIGLGILSAGLIGVAIWIVVVTVG